MKCPACDEYLICDSTNPVWKNKFFCKSNKDLSEKHWHLAVRYNIHASGYIEADVFYLGKRYMLSTVDLRSKNESYSISVYDLNTRINIIKNYIMHCWEVMPTDLDNMMKFIKKINTILLLI